MQTVHVRVNDSATGKPTPCRVLFADTAGNDFAPLGRRPTPFGAYTDGSFEIRLPPGPLTVMVFKGIEYIPLNTTMELLPGKLAMRFTLERWTDWRKTGWYAGDGRVHDLSPHEVLLQAAGEDLAVVELLARESPSGAFTNVVAFSGQKPCLEMPGHIVVVNTHNVYPEWGSLSLLHCHRAVYPVRLGKEGDDEWTLADWCDQCHRKQGLVVWAGTETPEKRLPGALAELMLGKVDAFELLYNLGQTSLGAETATASWETLLDAGYRVPLIGSSGLFPIGWRRTYAQLAAGEELSYRGWIEAVRAGRTIVTAGPLLLLTVDGRSPGSVIDLPGERPTVSVSAEVQSWSSFTTLEIIANGQLMAQAGPSQSSFPWSAQVTQEISFPDGGWITAICRGKDGRGEDLVLARTSPVYVNVAGKVPPARHEARQTLAAVLAELQDRVKRLRPPNRRLLKVLESATKELS